MKKIFNEVKYLAEFQKEFKKLSKRFKTLQGDLFIFIDTALKLKHKIQPDYAGIVRMSDLGIEYPVVYKARKFACRSLKGKGAKSGIRIIYAYYEDKDMIEFIEIYYKGDKENEDKIRIKKYYEEH